METDLTALFVEVDDFCIQFQAQHPDRSLGDGRGRRRRAGRLSQSEVMTILIAFQTSHFRTFKHFYQHLLEHHRAEFPGLVCYGRFVRLMGRAAVPLLVFLTTRCLGEVSGISFIDATPLAVCSIKRKDRHRVFAGLARLGRSSVGWFFGFKLHLVINDRGELLGWALRPGDADEREPVDTLTRRLWGKLFGDKGYLSKALFERLLGRGLKLVTPLRKNMANKLMEWEDKVLLRKRALIETVNDQLKNVCQVEHTRHRSPMHFLVHLMAGLIAYARQPKKPSLRFHPAPQAPPAPLALPA
jgi:hypothetical protein